jgi:hypothetical protein
MPRLVISALGIIAVLLLAHSAYSVDVNEFLAQREQFQAEESFRILGGSITLNADEQLVNNMLMTAKTLEYDQSFSNLDFAPANHFFLSKPLMLQSEVFKFTQKMPKGKINSLILHINIFAVTHLTTICIIFTLHKAIVFYKNRWRFAYSQCSRHSGIQ